IRKNTKLLYLESPGSLTFELQNVSSLTSVAKRNDVISIMDNTWATSLFFKPLEMGVDVAIQSASKYIIGHSDALLGVAVSNNPILQKIRKYAATWGNSVSADDCYLALRGLRTLPARLNQQQKSALLIATWFASQSKVKEVIYPPLDNSEHYD